MEFVCKPLIYIYNTYAYTYTYMWNKLKFIANTKTISSHYCDVIMSPSKITSFTIVYSIVYSGTDQRKHQSSASLAFVRGIHRRPVNSPHKWPVTRKMFPFDDVIMTFILMFSHIDTWQHVLCSFIFSRWAYSVCHGQKLPRPGLSPWTGTDDEAPWSWGSLEDDCPENCVLLRTTWARVNLRLRGFVKTKSHKIKSLKQAPVLYFIIMFVANRSYWHGHWMPRVGMMQTSSSLGAPEIVVTTTCGDARVYKVGIMTNPVSQCMRYPLSNIHIWAWINEHMPRKVWDEITYPFPNSSDCSNKISNFIPYAIMDIIICPRRG